MTNFAGNIINYFHLAGCDSTRLANVFCFTGIFSHRLPLLLQNSPWMLGAKVLFIQNLNLAHSQLKLRKPSASCTVKHQGST